MHKLDFQQLGLGVQMGSSRLSGKPDEMLGGGGNLAVN